MSFGLIKYSILMPCYQRVEHLGDTLVSFRHHYGSRSDFELVLVEDAKSVRDDAQHRATVETVRRFSSSFRIRHILGYMETLNPAMAFNVAAEASCGKFLVITNPECFHPVDILAGMDAKFSANDGVYVVCACRNVGGYKFGIDKFEDFTYGVGCWYQHTKENHRMLHFCSAIRRDLYFDIGGFDEAYKDGLAYEDADFREKILAAKIPIVCDDSMLVLHMDHSRNYQVNDVLVEKNKSVYYGKWKKIY